MQALGLNWEGEMVSETPSRITSIVTTFKVGDVSKVGETKVDSSAPDAAKDSAGQVPFASWLGEYTFSAAEIAGFWSAEILRPRKAETAKGEADRGAADKDAHLVSGVWTCVQRFDSSERAEAWQNSEVKRQALAHFKEKFGSLDIVMSETQEGEGSVGSVTAAIETYVEPGSEKEYWHWKRKIEAAQALFPGYRGSYLQSPAPGRENLWCSIVRYDSPEEMEAWFVSEERKEILGQGEKFAAATRIRLLSSSFPGWEPQSETAPVIPPWKTAMLVVLGLYPLLMLLRRFVVPYFAGMNTAEAVAITSLISVSLISFVCMPNFIKAFTWWLLPEGEDTVAVSRKGFFCVAGIFAVEILLLWHLLPPMPVAN